MLLKDVSYAHQGCVYFDQKHSNIVKYNYNFFSILICFKTYFIPVIAKLNSVAITLVMVSYDASEIKMIFFCKKKSLAGPNFLYGGLYVFCYVIFFSI